MSLGSERAQILVATDDAEVGRRLHQGGEEFPRVSRRLHATCTRIGRTGTRAARRMGARTLLTARDSAKTAQYLEKNLRARDKWRRRAD